MVDVVARRDDVMAQICELVSASDAKGPVGASFK